MFLQNLQVIGTTKALQIKGPAHSTYNTPTLSCITGKRLDGVSYLLHIHTLIKIYMHLPIIFEPSNQNIVNWFHSVKFWLEIAFLLNLNQMYGTLLSKHTIDREIFRRWDIFVGPTQRQKLNARKIFYTE